MLSRTLGMEFGGAVGILFYFANIVGAALNISACVEGLSNSFGAEKGVFIPDGGWGLPEGRWWTFLYCSIFNFLNLCLALVGSELFGKFSLGIVAMVNIWYLYSFRSSRIANVCQSVQPCVNNTYLFVRFTSSIFYNSKSD